MWSGCISVLTAAEPRQGPSWELGQDLKWPLISGSGCLGPRVLTRSTGRGQARWDWVVAGSPRRKVSQGWGREGPEEWSLRTLTAGRDLLSKTKGHLQRAAVSGTPRETRAKRPGDELGQERTGHRRTDRQTGLHERRKVGGRGELLLTKFRLKLKKVGKSTRPFRCDLNQIPYDYTVEVTNRFNGLDLTDRVPEELWMEVHDRRQGSRPSPRKRNAKRQNDCLRRTYK